MSVSISCCSSKSLDDIWSSSASVNLVGVAVEEEPASMSWAVRFAQLNVFNMSLIYFLDKI